MSTRHRRSCGGHEEDLRHENRKTVLERSRMWQTVDSSGSDSDVGGESVGPNIARAYGTKDSTSRRRERNAGDKTISKRSRGISSSESSGDSDSVNDGADDNSRRKRRSRSWEGDRSRRRSKQRKEEKKSKKRKKRKEDKKKSKKKRKQRSSSKEASSTCVDQNQFGKYGIIRESDFHVKSQSFETWLREIKKIPELRGPKWETMNYFKEYMEDYNTATLPHKKYYDVEKWEMQQYEKSRSSKSKHFRRTGLTDEEQLRLEKRREKERKQEEEFKLILGTMDKDKIQAMRRQEHLKKQMQLYYKSGNLEEARKLEQLLFHEEDELQARYMHRKGVAEDDYLQRRNAAL